MAAPVRPHPPEPGPHARPMTLEQFLAWEETQRRRHEFVDGRPRAMTGSTLRHNVIAGNVYSALRPAARRAGCQAYMSDVQVLTPSGRVYYPDVVVRCGVYAPGERQARTPCLIVEVTSPSTRDIDVTEKLDAYRSVPSVRMYLIVEQAVRRIQVHARLDDGTWTEWEASDASGASEVATPCVDVVLTLDAVYEDTDIFPPPDLRAGAPRPAADGADDDVLP